jgi:hypothetical protein
MVVPEDHEKDYNNNKKPTKQFTTTNLINTAYAVQDTDELECQQDIQSGWTNYFKNLNEILRFPTAKKEKK